MNKYEKFEGLVAGDGNPFWNQSHYWNCYDREACWCGWGSWRTGSRPTAG